MYYIYGIIGVVFILLILILVFVYHYDKEILINLAYTACTDAEAYFGSGKGQEKLNSAVAQIQSKLPSFAKVFFSETAIKAVIESLVLPVLQKIFIKIKPSPNVDTKEEKIKVAKKIIKSVKEAKKAKKS